MHAHWQTEVQVHLKTRYYESCNDEQFLDDLQGGRLLQIVQNHLIYVPEPIQVVLLRDLDNKKNKPRVLDNFSQIQDTRKKKSQVVNKLD